MSNKIEDTFIIDCTTPKKTQESFNTYKEDASCDTLHCNVCWIARQGDCTDAYTLTTVLEILIKNREHWRNK